MSNSDTAVTLIALALAAALVIYLAGWYGVAGVALFVLLAAGYAASGEANRKPSALRNMMDGFRLGIGLLALAVLAAVVAVVLRSC